MSDVLVVNLERERLKQYKQNYVKKIECGNVTEIVKLRNKPKEIPVVKIDADHYYCKSDINVDTGEVEVKEYNHGENKKDNIQSVKRSLTKLRRIINTNISGVECKNLRWVTLLYKENMTDYKRLYSDFDKFNKRFKYYCKKNNLEVPEYIAVCEPQCRGAWHMHILYIYKSAAPFIDNNTVFAPLWGHGFTKIKQPKGNIDNLGAYFSVYLSDLDVTDEENNKNAITKINSEGKEKRIKKGERLKMYPLGMNIYRCSKGIKKPIITEVSPKEYKNDNMGTLTYECGCLIYDNNGKELNVIVHEYYNKKRTEKSCYK